MASETIKLEDGPKTEAASIAAQTAVLAAEQAVESATEIAASAQRAAAAETARLTEDTAKALGANKDDMEWLKEELTILKSQALETKASLAEMISDFRSATPRLTPPLPEMDNPPVTELPISPPEGEDQRAPKTAVRKRRLI